MTWTKRTKVIVALSVGAAIVGVAAALPVVNRRLLTGRFVEVEKIETLQSPAPVKGWDEDGLILEGGRRVALPGVSGLPSRSKALAEATSRGVEMGDDGRVYGLVKVHHWCGNDPVRTHVARADLARMLEYLGQGEPKRSGEDWPLPDAGGCFTEYGWDISEWLQFRTWCHLRDLRKACVPAPSGCISVPQGARP